MKNYSISDSLSEVKNYLKHHDWFHDVDVDSLGRIAVYVNFMNPMVFKIVPERVDGTHVLIHFAGSKTIRKEDFVQELTSTPPKEEDSDKEFLELYSKLNELETICGLNILTDIFFESHDASNAITNLSSKYPEIREKMNSLYEEYGFDVIHDELEFRAIENEN